MIMLSSTVASKRDFATKASWLAVAAAAAAELCRGLEWFEVWSGQMEYSLLTLIQTKA